MTQIDYCIMISQSDVSGFLAIGETTQLFFSYIQRNILISRICKWRKWSVFCRLHPPFQFEHRNCDIAQRLWSGSLYLNPHLFSCAMQVSSIMKLMTNDDLMNNYWISSSIINRKQVHCIISKNTEKQIFIYRLKKLLQQYNFARADRDE